MPISRFTVFISDIGLNSHIVGNSVRCHRSFRPTSVPKIDHTFQQEMLRTCPKLLAPFFYAVINFKDIELCCDILTRILEGLSYKDNTINNVIIMIMILHNYKKMELIFIFFLSFLM